MGDASERLHGVVHEQHGGRGASVEGIACRKHGRGSGRHRGFGKVMAVDTFSGYGGKKISGLHLTVVGGGAAQHHVCAMKHFGMGGPGGRFQSHQHETSSLSIS